MKNKKILLVVGCVSIVILVMVLCIISNINKKNKIKANRIAAYEIENAIANSIFTKTDGTEILVLRTNDDGEFLEEKFELSKDNTKITNRKSKNESWSKICMSISLSNEINSEIGKPIYENGKIVGIGNDYYFATDVQKEMIKTFEQKESTKVSLSELLPICKEFFQKSISIGNLTDDLKTEYHQNDIDITITNNSIGVLSIRLYITYPTKQTPYSDAKITGVRVSAVYRDTAEKNNIDKYNLEKYVLPYLESFPNSLNREQGIVEFIKNNGVAETTLHTAPKARYNEIATVCQNNGITYTYTESTIEGAALSFHDILEIEVNRNYNIYLSDYPDFNISK